MDYRFTVDFDDVDYGRVVYFARYLRFAEKANARNYRRYGLSNRILAETYKIGAPVVRSDFSYLSPARLDDRLMIATKWENLSEQGFEVHYLVMKESDRKLICRGVTYHRFIDVTRFVSVSAPESLMKQLIQIKLDLDKYSEQIPEFSFGKGD